MSRFVGVAALEHGARGVENGRADDLRRARPHLDLGPRVGADAAVGALVLDKAVQTDTGASGRYVRSRSVLGMGLGSATMWSRLPQDDGPIDYDALTPRQRVAVAGKVLVMAGVGTGIGLAFVALRRVLGMEGL